MLDRDEDMTMSGTRHPFLGRYKVGFTKEGLIKGLQLDLYANCGYSWDLSPPVSVELVILWHVWNVNQCCNLLIIHERSIMKR